MDDKIQEKLKNLLILYQKKLPSKIEHIEAQWQAILEHWDMEKVETLHRDIHSLCGSAGTYGFSTLAKAARQAEIPLKKLLNEEEPSDLEKNLISSYLTQLKSASYDTPEATLGFDVELTPQHTTSKRVYIVEKDVSLTKELIENLSNMGFQPFSIQDTITLALAIKEEPPIAIIINSSFMDNDCISFLNHRNHTEQPIQLFCLISNTDLLPRLLAVRAHCDAFFQLPLELSYFAHIFQSKCSTSTDRFRILIVDDSETLAQYYSLILTKAGMKTRVLTDPMQLLQVWKSFQPDLLLMDIYMPECTGLELAAVLRLERTYTKTPIIFLSTEDDQDKILFAISLGGEDFLSKPVSPQHLISAVRSRAKRASVLNYYIASDSLTGLLNHSSVLTQLDIELARAKQKKIPLTVIMIDIDYFKQINDKYGHPTGDKVLKQLAQLFLIYLRNQDIIGRYGGEEFLIILPGTAVIDGERICNELRLQFNQYSFKDDNHTFHTTFSAGISYLKEDEETSNLINEADQALYQAKNKGRNQAVVFPK